MSVGDVAGLIAAIAFAVLVIVIAVPLVKLGGVLDEARGTVRQLTEHTLPAIDEAVETIRTTNGQLAKVDTVTTSAARMTEDVSALTTLLSATLGGPLVKVSAFSYAVRSTFRRGDKTSFRDSFRTRESELHQSLLDVDEPSVQI